MLQVQRVMTFFKLHLALVFLSLVTMGAACQTWQDRAELTLKGFFEGAKMADEAGAKVFHAQCLTLAQACKVEKEKVVPPATLPATKEERCPKVAKCLELEHKIQDATIGFYNTLASGKLAIQLGNETDWTARAVTLKSLATKLQEALNAFQSVMVDKPEVKITRSEIKVIQPASSIPVPILPAKPLTAPRKN